MLVMRRYGNVYQFVFYNESMGYRWSVRDESNVNTIASWNSWITINLKTLSSMVAAASADE